MCLSHKNERVQLVAPFNHANARGAGVMISKLRA